MRTEFLKVSHLINDLVEDVFAIKGMDVHVRMKQANPVYGDVAKDDLDIEVTMRVVEAAAAIDAEIDRIANARADRSRSQLQGELCELLGAASLGDKGEDS